MHDWPDLVGRVEDVAPRLLGAVLHHGDVAVRLTEVEAYGGPQDPASHAFRGPTPRSAVMFGPAGTLYCYLSYGMHTCANVVVGATGEAAAVLLRAGVVVAGHDVARLRRPGAPDHQLARGPALLCRALGIDLSHNASDLLAGPVQLALSDATEASPFVTGGRVGVRGGADLPWRFQRRGDPTVSAYRRHPKASGDPAPGV